MATVSVVLPTLDEAENIVALLRAIIEAVPGLLEIIVVDDDSPDRTADLAADFAKTVGAPAIHVERLPRLGLTASLRRGVGACRGDVVVWMDCDFSMPPRLIPELLRQIEAGCDIAVGSRFAPGGSFKKNTEGTPDSPLAVFLSRVMNYSIRFLLDPGFHDYTSGFAAVRSSVLKAIPFSGDYGEYFIDFIFRALRAGYRVKEIAYVCVPRRAGYSKTGQNVLQYFQRGKKYIWLAVRLRFLAFLGRL